MAQSQNSSVYYTEHATSFHGMATYGNVMLGNKAFEFYNERNPEDYIQIPWDEVDTIVASVLFKGRKISRFAVMTKSSGTFSFSSRDNKALLRAVANYVDKERMVRSLSFLDVIKRSIRRIVHRKKEDQASC